MLDFTEAGANLYWAAGRSSASRDGISGDMVTVGYIFAFKVLPTIIFFPRFPVLYYLGILQVIIKGFAWVMTRTMNLTGAEAWLLPPMFSSGQTEAPLIVKPYLEGMSKSPEILCLMTGAWPLPAACFAAYVGFLGGTDPVAKQLFATHLLTASIIFRAGGDRRRQDVVPETRQSIWNTKAGYSPPGCGKQPAGRHFRGRPTG